MTRRHEHTTFFRATERGTAGMSYWSPRREKGPIKIMQKMFIALYLLHKGNVGDVATNRWIAILNKISEFQWRIFYQTFASHLVFFAVSMQLQWLQLKDLSANVN